MNFERHIWTKFKPGVKWLYLLMAVLLVAVWHMPIAAFVLRVIGTPPPAAPRTAYTFATLAYGPVGGQHGIALDRVAEHLDILQAGGFVPITLEDVHDLLYADQPVPERAVLLTFDQPRARSWRALSHLIRSPGWRATAFILTGDARGFGDSPPGWRLLRLARGEGRWSIAPQGGYGPLRIPIDADGRTECAFTTRQWLETEARPESLYEYHARIFNDQRRAYDAIANGVRAAPLAFAYPDGSFGQDGSDIAIRNLIRLGTTGRQFRLGFVAGTLAYNGRHSDPLRLNRLRVDPAWSGSTLLRQLNTLHANLPLHYDHEGKQRLGHWIVDREGVHLIEGQWHLADRGGQPPARLWISGSPAFQDGELEMTVRPGDGTLHWWLRATPDDQHGLHVQWHQDGTLMVHAITEYEAHPLARAEPTRDTDRAQHLRFILRGPFLQIEQEGQPVFARPVRVPQDWPPGYIGIGIGRADADTPARVRLDALSIKPSQKRIAVWDADIPVAQAVRNLHQHAHRYAVISPTASALERENDPRGIVRAAYRTLAQWHQIPLIPMANITVGTTLFQQTPPQAWSEQVARLEGDGIYIRMLDHGATPFGDIEAWLEQVWAQLEPTGKQVMVHFADARRPPQEMTALAEALPGLRWAATPNDIEAGFPLAAPLVEEKPPTVPATEELLLYHELRPRPDRDDRRARQRQADALAEAGHTAYREEQFEQAIAHFSDWHSLEPRNPAPLNFIANALEQLSFRDEAVDFLQQSLALAPGQTEHLERLVNLLDALGRNEAARELLNQYALLFPDNADIQAVQAEWLIREQRHEEARTLLARSLRNRPTHLPTALLLLRIAERPDERLLALRTTLREGARPEHHARLVAAARDHDLLTRPHTGELNDLLQRIASETDQPQIREMIQALRPRAATIAEVYGDRGLSSEWELEGAIARPTATGLQLRADAGQRAFSLRLNGSQNWHDSFIEARLRPDTGHFWLTARRSHNQMLRFGYDESSHRLRLQRWETDGAERVIADERTYEWSLPADEAVTLRLEVRGNGALAYLNDEPVWPTPLLLPGTMTGGRVTLDGDTTAPGEARWELQTVAAGPIMAGIARLPAADGPLDEEWIERLQAVRHVLTDLSPGWFQRTADGDWQSQPSEDHQLLRIFADYHGLRLMPTIQVTDLESLTAGELRSVIALHELDGLILLHPTAPAADVLTAFAQQPEAQGLNLVFMTLDQAAPDEGEVYGLGAARALNRELDQPASLDRVSWDNLPDHTERLSRHTLFDHIDVQTTDAPTEQEANDL